LSNSLRVEDEDEPPAAELGLDVEEDELPPAAEDDEGEDDLLLCDVEGDDAPELLESFDASLA